MLGEEEEEARHCSHLSPEPSHLKATDCDQFLIIHSCHASLKLEIKPQLKH